MLVSFLARQLFTFEGIGDFFNNGRLLWLKIIFILDCLDEVTLLLGSAPTTYRPYKDRHVGLMVGANPSPSQRLFVLF